MDSQHRHELGENVLAHWLADKIDVVKPQLPLIVLVLGAVLVGGVGVNLWSDSASSIEEIAWEGYSQAVNGGAPNLPVLEQVADNNAGTSVVPWAGITWADGRLLEAAQGLLSPRQRDLAIAALDDAEAKYKEILASGATPAELKNRARLGLARSAELRGDVEGAIKAYGEVQGAFKELAEARAEELGEEEVQEAVIWLASAEASSMRAPFNPGAGAATQPDATPDPLDLPSDSPASSPATSADTFSDLLKSIEAGAASSEADENSEETTEGEMTDSAEEEGDSDAAATEASTETETPAGDSNEE